MPSITAYPPQVMADATCLLVYQGDPNKTVSWSLTGSGTITPFSNRTDATGKAGAKYTPGTAWTAVTVGVTAGA